MFVFYFRCFFLLLEDEGPQNVRSGRRGEEKWLYSHGKTLVKFIQIHWQLEILHISCRFIELSPSYFDNILRLLLSVGFCNSLTNTMVFFFSCTSQAQVEIAISRCFQDRILRRVTWISGPCCRLRPIRTFLVRSREVILSRKSNVTCLKIIYSTEWYKCLMVTVFMVKK